MRMLLGCWPWPAPTSGEELIGRIASALEWLWRHRRTPDGLMYVVHPWETGTDDSPRWDDWVSLPTYDHAAYSAFDRGLVAETYFDNHGCGGLVAVVRLRTGVVQRPVCACGPGVCRAHR